MKKRAVILLLAGALMAQTVFLGACGSEGVDAGEQQESVQQLEEEDVSPAEESVAETGQEREAAETTAGAEKDGDAAEGKSTTAAAGGDTADLGAGLWHEDGANGFAFRFSKGMLGEKAEGENMIVSPYSVWLPLAALVNGTDEEAKEELLSALGRSGMDADTLNEEVKNAISILTQEEQVNWMKENGQADYEGPLKIANALFVDQKSQADQDFEAIFAESYAGKLFSVDFTDESAVRTVNDWAKEQTNGKIDRVIESFDPQTVAALANAIYYSDGWAKEFPKENTKNDIFNGSGQEEEVPFMNQEFPEMPYYEDDAMQAASLGTSTGGRLTVLLPKEGGSAEELLAGIDADKFDKLMESGEATVQLSLPKFKVESEVFSVKEVMERLGVPLTDGENPHLDGIAEGELLYITQAVQKAMIEVDEEGMTAAAVTVMALERLSLEIPQEPVEMKCDRPFAFILSACGSEGYQVLFTGVVNQIGK